MFNPTILEQLGFIKNNNSFIIDLPLVDEGGELVYENGNFSIDCTNEGGYNGTSVPLFPESIEDIQTLIKLLTPPN